MSITQLTVLLFLDPFASSNDIFEDDYKLDPTYSDSDRICADSLVSQLISQYNELKAFNVHSTTTATTNSNTKHKIRGGSVSGDDSSNIVAPTATTAIVQCYMPCRIRFTLLAQCLPRTAAWTVSLHSSSTTSAAAATNTKPRDGAGGYGYNSNNNQHHQQQQQERYSRILGNQVNPLTIGSEHTVARLVASTLWLSVEAGRAIWQCARGGEANAIYHEAQQRRVAYSNCLDEGAICQAYQHAMISSLLSQNYRLVTPLYRSYNCIAFKLRKMMHSMSFCRTALTTCSNMSNTSSSSYAAAAMNQWDVLALGHTITRHVCLATRYLILSPQVAHLRGGCSHILKEITKLEELLQLAAIPVECATTNSFPLPDKLLLPGSQQQHQYQQHGNQRLPFSLPYGNKNKNTSLLGNNATTVVVSNSTTSDPSSLYNNINYHRRNIYRDDEDDGEDFEAALQGNGSKNDATTTAVTATAASSSSSTTVGTTTIGTAPPPLLSRIIDIDSINHNNNSINSSGNMIGSDILPPYHPPPLHTRANKQKQSGARKVVAVGSLQEALLLQQPPPLLPVQQQQQKKKQHPLMKNNNTIYEQDVTNNVAIVDSGEMSFRKALTKRDSVTEAVLLLNNLEGMCQVLLYALSKDMHANFLDIDAAMSSNNTASSTATSAVYSSTTTQSINISGDSNRNTSSSLLQQSSRLPMISASDAMDAVLGKDCETLT